MSFVSSMELFYYTLQTTILRGNSLADSNDKNIMNIVNNIVGENKNIRDNKIKYSLWDDCMTVKTSIGKTPFELVYRMEA
jgi:hypothetical protein